NKYFQKLIFSTFSFPLIIYSLYLQYIKLQIEAVFIFKVSSQCCKLFLLEFWKTSNFAPLQDGTKM
ncbi:MAG: hypothetical protein NC218_12595, partial [Acetobacter sp.]|nr:hypothetical protein [Acetobacter sp.]